MMMDKSTDRSYDAENPNSFTTSFNCKKSNSSEYKVSKNKIHPLQSGHVILTLNHQESICFHGMLSLRIYKGTVSIYGAKLELGRYYNAYAPNWSSALILQGFTSTNECIYTQEIRSSFRKDRNRNLLHNINIEAEEEADKIARVFSSKYPIVIICNSIKLSLVNIDCFDTFNENGILPGFSIVLEPTAYNAMKKKFSQEKDESSSFLQLFSKGPTQALIIPEIWPSIIQQIFHDFQKTDGKPSSILVCGGKSVGKSTFCRYLVNQMLTRSSNQVVAFLDTDMGQPEFTPSGIISLHLLTTPIFGPAHTHLKVPFRCYYFGHNNPKYNPLLFIHYVELLLSIYQLKFRIKNIPLVINTNGWIKSMGHDLLGELIQKSQPTDIVQLIGNSVAKRFDMPWKGSWKIYCIGLWTTQPPLPSRSSEQLRQCRLRAYFLQHVEAHQLNIKSTKQIAKCCAEKAKGLNEIVSLYLSNQKTHILSFNQFAIIMEGTIVPPSQLGIALNATIVGLCIDESMYCSTYQKGVCINQLDNQDISSIRLILEPSNKQICIGIGIITSIDITNKKIHLLSPINIGLLKHVNVLVRGTLPLPQELLPKMEIFSIPYCNSNIIQAEGSGSSEIHSRQNLKRKKESLI